MIKLTIFVFNFDRLEGVDVAVSQGVSQASGTQIVPMADDMLQSRMMMIEDIIESIDVSYKFFCDFIIYFSYWDTYKWCDSYMMYCSHV